MTARRRTVPCKMCPLPPIVANVSRMSVFFVVWATATVCLPLGASAFASSDGLFDTSSPSTNTRQQQQHNPYHSAPRIRNHSRTNTATGLNLFDLRKSGGAAAAASRSSTAHRATTGVKVAFPKLVTSQLGTGAAQSLPCTVDLSLAESGLPYPDKCLVVRYADYSDINQCIDMIVDEFGSLGGSSDATKAAAAASLPGQLIRPPRESLDEIFDQVEDWALSLTVRLGLWQRIQCQQSTSGNANAQGTEPDHHVIIIEERSTLSSNSGKSNKRGEIVGMVELSQQIPDPERIATALVIPLFVKQILGKMGIGNRAAVAQMGVQPVPYVSNVLVKPQSRGRGYSRILMAAAEGLARDWNRIKRDRMDSLSAPSPMVCLHVDADSKSGRAAQGLYRALGYRGVPDDRTGTSGGGGKFAWLGQNMLSTGLYMVDGLPLLFMSKELPLD